MSHDLRYIVLRWYTYQHVNIVGLKWLSTYFYELTNLWLQKFVKQTFLFGQNDTWDGERP